MSYQFYIEVGDTLAGDKLEWAEQHGMAVNFVDCLDAAYLGPWGHNTSTTDPTTAMLYKLTWGGAA
jgi:hypothetical protein